MKCSNVCVTGIPQSEKTVGEEKKEKEEKQIEETRQTINENYIPTDSGNSVKLARDKNKTKQTK